MSPRHAEIDPCIDFDAFVCEGWRENNDLRDDQGGAFTGTQMAENSQRILRHILETAFSDSHPQVDPETSAEGAIFQKLKDGYNACMDEDRLKEIGSKPLLNILLKIEDLFPATRPHHESRFFPKPLDQSQKSLKYDVENQLSTTVAYLISVGVTSLVSFPVSADDKDPDSVVLSMNAPRRPGLPSKEYYQDTKMLESYSSTIGQVLESLLREAMPNATDSSESGSKLSTYSEGLVKALVDFETKLAEATPSTEEAEDVTQYYNPMTLDETESLVPQLSMQYIIAGLAPPGYVPERIIVGSPSYLRALSDILKNTSVETIQAYFVWKTVQRFASRVEDDALKPLLQFNNQLLGKAPDATEERWRTCVNVVDDGLGWILSKFFIEKAFSEEAKNFGNQIVSDIKTQFVKKLKAAEWMSKDVRELGIKKVHNIVQKIGYPTKSPDVRNSSALQEYYRTVNISSTAFFNNAISIAKFDTTQQWSALGKPTNRNEWGMSAPTVNAYYNPAGNEIVFPAGIMQSPVFYPNTIPPYLSYGAFGSVSGHELSHAFDSSGRHYDETGNFTEWWDAATIDAFTEKAQCFIDQYHDFTVPGPGPGDESLHVNGRLTLGENIADAGGLSAAFAAWKEVEKKKTSQLLPGLQRFSKEQVFFISYSNWWCGKTRREAAVDRIYRDPHAPTWARILVSLLFSPIIRLSLFSERHKQDAPSLLRTLFDTSSSHPIMLTQPQGTMANSRAFRESFNCPQKKPTCELW